MACNTLHKFITSGKQAISCFSAIASTNLEKMVDDANIVFCKLFHAMWLFGVTAIVYATHLVSILKRARDSFIRLAGFLALNVCDCTMLTSATSTTGSRFGSSATMSYDLAYVVEQFGDFNSTVFNKGTVKSFQMGFFYDFTEDDTFKPTPPIDPASGYYGNCIVSIDDTFVVGSSMEDGGDGAIYINYLHHVDQWGVIEKVSGDGQSGEQFGHSLSLDSLYLAVGAPNSAVGFNDDQGLVYIYLAVDWSYETVIASSDGATNDLFGYSVSVYDNTLAVGAVGVAGSQGAVYVFSKTVGWDEDIKLVAPDGSPLDLFGFSLSIDQYTLVLVGAPNHKVGGNSDQGSAYIFHVNGSLSSLQANLVASDGEAGDNFGYSVSLYYEDAVVGSPFSGSSLVDSGSVYTYHKNLSNWDITMKIQAPSAAAGDNFGYSVFISHTNYYLMIGAPNTDRDACNTDTGAVHLYVNGYYGEIANWEYACPATQELFQGECTYCPDYYYKFSAGQNCTICPAGHFCNGLYAYPCSAGTYSYEGGFYCISCPAGTYNPFQTSTDVSACQSCPEGKYQPYEGRIGLGDCTNCTTGTYGNIVGAADANQCSSCLPGKFTSTTGETNCTNCPADSIQLSSGQSFCSPCPLGFCTTDLDGQTTCADCSNLYIITNVSGCADNIADGSTSDCPTVGGVELTILGSGWDSLFFTEASVTVGGSDCAVTSVGSGLVKCLLNEGVGLDLDVVVTKSSQGISGSSTKLSFSSASIDFMHGCDDSEALPDPDGTSACSRDGLDEVTVSGNNLGPGQASVLIGGVKATLISLSSRGLSGWEQNTTIVLVPSGSGLGVGVNVLQKGGELSDGVRMLSYKSCDPGFYNLRNDSTGIYDCVECALGYYNLANESFSCELCPSGSYCSSSSISSCDSILSGSSSPSGSTDSSDCVCPSSFLENGGSCTCDVGYGYDGGLDACVECALGKYKDVSSKTSCSDCPEIMETVGLGSMDVSDCVCPTTFLDDGGSCTCDVGYGYDGVTGVCVTCYEDSIKNEVSLSTCSLCKSIDLNLISNVNNTACICDKGFVFWSFDSNCVECPSGMICDEDGSVLTSISLESGYWRESSTDLSTRECPYETACTGSSDTSDQCIDGHSGPLCAVCEDGYTSANSNSACDKCFKGNHAAGFSVVIIILLFMMLFSVLLSQVDDKTLQSWKKYLKSLSSNRGIRTRFRILLAYFQIIGSFTFVLDSDLPANYTTFLTISQTASLNFGSIFSPRCFNPDFTYYDSLVTQTVGPIVVGILILIIFILSSITSPLNRDKAKSDFLTRIFLSSFIFFPSASTAVFQMFNCDDDFASGSSYLKVDYRLECGGPEYDGYRAYALLMILIYPLGIPLFYFASLSCVCGRIRRSHEEKPIGESDQLAALQEDHDAVNNLDVSDNDVYMFVEKLKQNVNAKLSIERACVDPATSPYSSLFGAYKPEYWYWECIECMRRLSLTGLLVFMYPGSEKQVLLAMALCFLFLIAYSWVQPYVDSAHTFFMMMSQYGIFLQLYIIYLITSHTFPTSETMLGNLCVVIGVAFFAFSIAVITKHVFVRQSHLEPRGVKEVKIEMT